MDWLVQFFENIKNYLQIINGVLPLGVRVIIGTIIAILIVIGIKRVAI